MLLFKALFPLVAICGVALWLLGPLLLTNDPKDEFAGMLRRYGKIMTFAGALLAVCFASFKTIPAGHYGAATLFGEPMPRAYEEGLHFPVNPLYEWTVYDARNKSMTQDDTPVQTSDRLTSLVDFSIQYRVKGEQAPQLLRETGTVEALVEVHLTPAARSIFRERARAIPAAQELFKDTVQQRLQDEVLRDLQEFVAPKGLDVTQILIRNIQLPKFILDAIQAKKEREESVDRERAELERVEVAAQQQVKQAEAQKLAADSQAQAKIVLADATAYEIAKINEAIRNNPAYIQLQALEALKAISQDPNAKVYFLNGDSPAPLPLMHLGTKE